MEPDETRHVEANYTVMPQRPPKERASGAMVLAVIASCVAGVAIIGAVIAIVLYFGARSTSSFQTTQIHGLDQSYSRLAGEYAALSNRQAQTSAQVAASDPASDSNLITCSDLRHMHLATVNSGSVSSVPGTVDLSQNPVPLPGHCK